MTGIKCSKPGCKGWAKRGTTRCVFHPADATGAMADVGNILAQALPPPTLTTHFPKATTARCNVCRSPIPAGRAGCPNAWMHSPGFKQKERS